MSVMLNNQWLILRCLFICHSDVYFFFFFFTPLTRAKKHPRLNLVLRVLRKTETENGPVNETPKPTVFPTTHSTLREGFHAEEETEKERGQDSQKAMPPLAN